MNHEPRPADHLNRRELLARTAQISTGACLACVFGSSSSQVLAADPTSSVRLVDYTERIEGSQVQCRVCPRHCILDDGDVSYCRSHKNVRGQMTTLAYSNPCVLSADPIEKLPMNHFRPGTETLSIATGGCNLRCLYCQNWEQSQVGPNQIKTFELTPKQAIAEAKKKKIDTIVFTYTEPVSYLEYAIDIAQLARKAKMKVVVGTAAYIEPKPLMDFAKFVDAFTVTLKGFDDDFYVKMTGAHLDPVLSAIRTIRHETECWLEIVNLIVPTYNDQPEKIRAMCRWLKKNGCESVPVHFSRFVPMYRLKDLPNTPVQTLESACRIADEEGLQYAYTANIAPHDGANTVCPHCHHTVIERFAFKIKTNSLDQNGQCPHCQNKLPGVWK